MSIKLRIPDEEADTASEDEDKLEDSWKRSETSIEIMLKQTGIHQ